MKRGTDIQLFKGKKFNMLTVIGSAGMSKPDKHGKRYVMAEFLCECGVIKTLPFTRVKTGQTKSCSCNVEVARIKAVTKHGGTNGVLYNVWNGIKSRCFCKSDSAYKYYGGRGISMCDDWRYNFQSFLSWCLSNGYKKGLDLDRVNGNGNYDPWNCRFITHAENNRNKRPNINTSSYDLFQIRKYGNVVKQRAGIYDEDDIRQDV